MPSWRRMTVKTVWIPGRKGKKQQVYYCGGCGKPSYFILTEPGKYCTWCGREMGGVQVDIDEMEVERNAVKGKKSAKRKAEEVFIY